MNADKTKYMVMSLDRNAGRSQHRQTDDSSFETMDEFKYVGTTQTKKKKSIQEEIKSRWKSVSDCYSMQI